MSYFYYIYCHFSLCNHLIPYKQDAWIGQMPKAVLRRQDFDDFPTSSQSDNYTYAVIFPFCCCCSFSIILWFEDCELLCSFASGTQLTKIPVKWLSVWLGYSCYFVARVCYRKKFFFLLFFFSLFSSTLHHSNSVAARFLGLFHISLLNVYWHTWVNLSAWSVRLQHTFIVRNVFKVCCLKSVFLM